MDFSFFIFTKIEKYIVTFADLLNKKGKKEFGIGFTGGESLLCWKELKPLLEKILWQYKTTMRISISINTNASLVSAEIADDFKRLGIIPSLSLDGLYQENDSIRVYKNGKGTFEDIIKGMDNLLAANVAVSGFYLTLTGKNFNFDEIALFKFASERGFKSITIEPDLIHIIDVPAEEICNKLLRCYEEGQKLGIELTGFWRRPFDNIASYKTSTNGFCRVLDFRSIVIDKDGFIEPCGYSDLRVTRYSDFEALLKDESYLLFVKNNLRGNIEECKNCEIEGICKGGCMISRRTGKGESAVFEYRCKIYREMTKGLLRIADFEAEYE